MSAILPDLIRRYDRPGPRYTSYPTALEFHPGVDADSYAEHLASASRVHAPISVYTHLPFCEERCYYCGCNVVATRNRDVSQAYLRSVLREIADVAERLDRSRPIRQLHWGGGTPTYYAPEQLRDLFAAFEAGFDLAPDAELSVEVDPRVTTTEHLETLAALGFNRLSLGVQDFTPEVQQRINRVQPFRQTHAFVSHARELGFGSINIDLIYGLPLQTRHSFRRTVAQVEAILPERVAIYSYAHVPWLRGHQKRMMQDGLPSAEAKAELLLSATRMLRDAGYVALGMDHFARPTDELSLAAREGTLWRNFMGYTVRNAPDTIAFGASGIGEVGGTYFQNEHKLSRYQAAVSESRLPTSRGYAMSAEDRLRRHVITTLMIHMRCDFDPVEREFGIDFGKTFAPELDALTSFVNDGLVRLHPERIEITPLGRLFVRNVCMLFDAYLEQHGSGKKRFSRTV